MYTTLSRAAVFALHFTIECDHSYIHSYRHRRRCIVVSRFVFVDGGGVRLFKCSKETGEDEELIGRDYVRTKETKLIAIYAYL